MGRKREQAQSEILLADPLGPEKAKVGNRLLEPLLRRRCRRPGRYTGGVMSLFRGRRQQFESDMDAELRFHFDAYVEDLMRSGIDRPEAERRARLEFGALQSVKDDCR